MFLSQELFIILLILIVAVLAKPMGLYLYALFDPAGKTFLDPVLKPLERLTYRLLRVDPHQEQTWKGYLSSVLLLGFACFLFAFILLLFQGALPFNLTHVPSLSWSLALNTAVSYATNTGWQNLPAESTLSPFSIVVPLASLCGIGGATTLSILGAFTRSLVRSSGRTVGNFWVDITRILFYLIFPLSLIAALLFAYQGSPQNLLPPQTIETIEGGSQTVIQGPIASTVGINAVASSGGNYTNVGSAHPYENPTPLTNLLQILFMLLIPAGQTYFFGKMVGSRRHGWILFFVMSLLFVASALLCDHFEATPHRVYTASNIESSSGNLEGKEVRFGNFGSTLFSVASTTASNGKTNSSLDAFAPLSGVVPLINLLSGQLIFGAAGAGLYHIVLFVLVALFLMGLIAGKPITYLGKRIDPFDLKMCMGILISFSLLILLPTTAALRFDTEGSPHSITRILYMVTSLAANNGSSFSGVVFNTPTWNVVLSLLMVLGRFFPIVFLLALCGSFVKKKRVATLEKEGPISFSPLSFIGVLIVLILLTTLLSFSPPLIMGALFEQLGVR